MIDLHPSEHLPQNGDLERVQFGMAGRERALLSGKRREEQHALPEIQEAGGPGNECHFWRSLGGIQIL